MIATSRNFDERWSVARAKGLSSRFSVPRLLRGTALVLGALCWPIAAVAEYSLRPGDTIAISTIGPFNIVHQSVVDADGRVTLPVIGQVPVGGQTLGSAQAQISAALSAQPLRLVGNDGVERWLSLQPNEVLVEVASYAPVFVTGTVGQPGRFSYTPGMTVRQLIAEAGGLGVGLLPDDPNSRDTIQLAADREVAAQRVESIMAQVNRLRDELRAVTREAAPEVSPGEPPAAEIAATPEVLPEATVILDEAFETVPDADGTAIPRPRMRPSAEEATAAVANDAIPLSVAEGEPALPVEQAAPDELPTDALPTAAAERAPLSAPAPAPGAQDGLPEIGRQLIEANVAVRDVNYATSRQLLAEMAARLDLLRRRQTDEESLVAHDRAELARVQDLIGRGLVPAAEADVAERALLMSSMQSYDTADSVARLEIEQARLTAELQRAPSEAARDLLLELEARTADAEVALAQLQSIDQRLTLLGGPTSAETTISFDFVLHRGSGADAVATPVDQDEMLLPGDVLEIIASFPDNVLSQGSR